jgi:hypothetical protein
MWRFRLASPVPQIATGDLDIAVLGQLPSTDLPFGDQFEPRPVKVVRFEAAFRRRNLWKLWKQDLENAPGHAHHPLIFADAYTELDDGSLGVPAGIGRKAKEHGPPWKCSSNVLPNGDLSVKAFCRSGSTAPEKIGQTGVG